MAAPLIEAAIEDIRRLIASGALRPGDRLPPEADLSAQLGISRGTTREAVRALVSARVLDVRRGAGTYVTSLSPELLLEGVGVAVELMQEEALLHLVETRRVIEPQVTALAAVRAQPAQLEEIEHHLTLMRAATDLEALVRHDNDFHAAVARAGGNPALAAVLIGISSPTLRARVWRGLLDADAHRRTVAEHSAIWEAVLARDPAMAAAAALLHVGTTEAWVRTLLDTGPDEDGNGDGAGGGDEVEDGDAAVAAG
ncbi:FadR/GntR family transcriptional regulator [Kineococcus sp. G2]|uniref:FadR/GntR family transcriptional regulator n=1 Tax=Kineococcus sp. G2 TaxID=3127484 RepID=UPI00301CBD48